MGSRSVRRLFSCALMLGLLPLGALLATPAAAANAGAGLSVLPLWPSTVVVGATGVPVEVSIQNASTTDQGAVTIASGGARLTPSCATLNDPGNDCGAPDLGVFAPSSSGMGAAGTDCAGDAFSIVPVAGSTTGEVQFNGPAIVLAGTDANNLNGGACIIDFTVNVLKVPGTDENTSTPGIQTTVRARADGKTAGSQATGPLTATGAGTSITTVSQATPAIATHASTTTTVGSAISDTATLSGGVNPTGVITFKIFGPNNDTCGGSPADSSAVPVNHGNGDYASTPFVTTATGTYHFVAAYSGDTNNAAPQATVCSDANETVVVAKATPTIVTHVSPGLTLGGSVTDTATLAGAFNPTGTITFAFFGPGNATCSGAPVVTSTVTVSHGNGDYVSAPFTPTKAGTYQAVATYSGDSNNVAPVATSCADANEAVVIAKVLPTLTTQASPTVNLGGSITDTATLAGGTSPTGTITFTFFGPNTTTCTGTPVFTSTVTVTGNGSYPSGPFTPTSPGTYRTIATYSGNSNNQGLTTACLDVHEAVVVNAVAGTATPSSSPTPPVAVLGESATPLPVTGAPSYLLPLGFLGLVLLLAGGGAGAVSRNRRRRGSAQG